MAAQLGRGMVRRRQTVRDNVTLADGNTRQPHFESLEPRVLLAGDLVFGSVYFEEASGDDSEADTVAITFLGGAEGTQLDRLVIDGDKKGDGLSEGDAFFDIASGGAGAFNYVGLSLDSHDGFDVTGVTVVDGGTLVVLEFSGFDAGEKLVFSVDVDEVGFVDPSSGALDSTSVVEGGEFQRSRLTGNFSAPHYADLQLGATFWDSYDDGFAETRAQTGRILDLPPDRYTSDDDLRDRTAGAITSALQDPLPITISGTVFADADLDNQQDSGEQGLENVRLHLWSLDPEAGQSIDTGKTALTDRLGAYRFDDHDGVAILPGRYEIREVQPVDYFSVGARAGNVDGVTRGVVDGPDTITQIDLLGGQDSVHNDFSEALPASLGGYVYHDASNDGRRDGDERGIANVGVRLVPVYTVDGSTAAIDTQTNADGFWQVSGLAPGAYDVVEPNQPAAYLDGLDRAGTVAGSTVGAAHNPGDEISDVQLQGGQSGVEYNFGELLPSSISGQVHASTDGNCTPGPNDILLADVQVDLLDESGHVLATTFTDQDGRYRFDGLLPDRYQVFEHQPEGYFDGPDHVGTAGGHSDGVDTILDIVLTSGTLAEEYNFCEHVGVRLSGHVYHDASNDGLFDADETGIGNVTLMLLDAEGRDTGLRTTTSNATHDRGSYAFTDLAAGTYGLSEVQPAGYLDGIDTPGNRGGQADNPGDRIVGVVLAFGYSGADYNFGELLPSTISGQVHASMDGDCTPGPHDILLANVEMDLLDDSGRVLTTTTTDQEGRYRFEDLTPGRYQVFEHQPDGYFDGPDHVGTAGGHSDGVDTILDIVLTSGTHAEEYNFCEYVGVRLSGHVYHDASNEGLFDAGETGIGGVTLALLDADGRDTGLRTTTSSAAHNLGYYAFADLRGGTYGVREVQPGGYLDGIDTPGNRGGIAENPGDRIVGVALPFGRSGADYNFGELLPSSVSGQVHASMDNDCTPGPDDILLAGVQMDLLDESGRILTTTTTDQDGRYRFDDLTPGRYQVFEHQPEGYFDGPDHVGTVGGRSDGVDTILDILLAAGTHAEEYNFCELLPSSISGQVHASTDGDCTPGPNDILLAGVQVDLLDESGDVLTTTYTDQDGRYRFENLTPGRYQVFEHQPEGYFDGRDHVGTAGGRSDGVDTIMDIPLTSGTHAEEYNFCEHVGVNLSGAVYHDANNDGRFDADETGIGGVTLMLLDAEDRDTGLRATTSTAAGNLGRYEFTNLRGGTYGVAEQQPEGYLDGIDMPGTRGGTAENPGDRIVGAALPSGQSGTDYNFGELLPARIGGSVRARTGQDCFVEEQTQPIAGVVIELLGRDGQMVATTTTDAGGRYVFTGLQPGTYAIHERQPAGYFQGSQRVGSGGGQVIADDRIGAIPAGSGQQLVDYDFCEVPATAISGHVFQDGAPILALEGVPDNVHELRDGLLTNDDRPIVGVTLELRQGVSGDPILASAALPGHYPPGPIRTTTDANGFYQFGGLAAGTYAIFEVHPSAYVDSIDTAGSAGGVAINPHEPVSPFVIQQLIVDPGDDAIIRIPLKAGETSTNNNFSEILVEPLVPPPVPPVPMPEPVTVAPVFLPVPERIWLPPRVSPSTPATPFGGSSQVIAYTWHLSVIDGGQPRSNTTNDTLVQMTSSRFDVVAWRSVDMRRSSWKFRQVDIDGEEARRRAVFGTPDAIPVTGDFNGDGITEQGVFVNGQWFIDLNGNGLWDPGDLWAKLGHNGDLPVTGDWDGDGKTDIGIFGRAWPGDPMAVDEEPGLPDPHNVPSGRLKNIPPDPRHAAIGARTMKLTSQGKMRADVIDHVFHYGTPGDQPVAGDWNGDGIDTIGVFRDGQWHVDTNGDGKWTAADGAFTFGQAGDVPVVGDWNGDGVDEVGIYRNGTWHLDANGNHQFDTRNQVFELGTSTDTPVTGDWNGDGVDEPGIYLRKTG